MNMPLTSRYTHSVITLDCYRDRDRGSARGVGEEGGLRAAGTAGTYVVQRRLVQCQAVVTAPIRVALEQKHGDMALGTHDDHVGVSHRTLHDGGAQVHRDEVQLIHCGHRTVSTGWSAPSTLAWPPACPPTRAHLLPTSGCQAATPAQCSGCPRCCRRRPWGPAWQSHWCPAP